MRVILLTVPLMIILSGCKTPELPPPEYPVETTFIINTQPQGAHIILASPQGYPPKYMGITPLNVPWSKVVDDPGEIPENFYVLAIREGSLPADEVIQYVNLQPTNITLKLEKGAPTVLTRNAFKSYSRGLMIDDLKTIWGAPIETSSTSDSIILYYSGITYDRLSETIDRNIQVMTENNRVTEVNFY